MSQFINKLLILLFLASSVNAGLGVARDNLPGDLLNIHPGETTWYGMRIQNPEDEDVTVSVLVTGGEGIVEIISPQDTYVIPANSHNTEIRLNIKIPKYALRGKEYPLKVFVGQSTDTTGGMVSMVGAVSFDMTVRVAGVLDVATLIRRTDLSEQVYPCLKDSDCRPGWGCKEEQRICYELPPPDILNEDFGKTTPTHLIFYILGVITLVILLAYAFRDSDFMWNLQRSMEDIIWEIRYRLP